MQSDIAEVVKITFCHILGRVFRVFRGFTG